MPIDNVGDEFVDALCDQVRRCPDLWGDEFGVLVNVFEAQARDASCEELIGNLGEATRAPREVAGVEAGTIDYNGAAGRRCLNALVGSCIPFDFADGLEECDDTFTGTVAVGGSCQATSECEPNAYCNNAFDCDGTCTARATVGQNCTTDDSCIASEGLVASCEFDGLESVCVEYAVERDLGVGEGCGAIDDEGTTRTVGFCASGLYCRTTDGDAGACALPLEAGSNCDEDDICEQGYFCAGGTCRTASFATTVGASCDDDAFIFCDGSIGLACDEDSGLCVNIGDGELGSPCTAPDDEFVSLFICDDGLYCDRDAEVPTCTRPLELDAPCDDDYQCESGYCVDDLCSEPVLCEDSGFVF